LPPEARSLREPNGASGNRSLGVLTLIAVITGVLFAKQYPDNHPLDETIVVSIMVGIGVAFVLALANRQFKLGLLSQIAEKTTFVLIPPLGLIFLVLGTIFVGIATPTEGGAMGATGAIITKGVGIIAALMLLPALWTHSEQIKQASRAQWLKGLAGPLFLLAACALWVVPMLLAVQHNPISEYLAYRNNILFHQTVTRYANAWHHIKPFWFYLVNVIPSFWLPWSLLLPWMVWQTKRDVKQGQRPVILLVGYLLLILLFFSASAGKRGVYITPATPVLALLVAYWLPELLTRRWPARLLAGLGWLLSGLFLCAGIFLHFLGHIFVIVTDAHDSKRRNHFMYSRVECIPVFISHALFHGPDQGWGLFQIKRNHFHH